jgi:hypothetical protein
MSHSGRSTRLLTPLATCLCEVLSSAALASLLIVPPPATGADGGARADPEPTVPLTVDRSSPDPQHPLVERFLAREDEPVRQFRARRLLRSKGLGREATMEVLVELDPEDGFRWEVLHEEGSKIMRNRGFRTLLKKEAEAYAAGDVSRSSLTGNNYQLSVAGVGADGLVRLRAEPRRKEKTLIDGTFTVTADDADLLSVEGRLAKGPSFWTPRVEIVRRYRRIRGHRVLVRMESTAHIRFLGEVWMLVDYDYLMIDGEEIPASSASPGDESASLEPPGDPIGRAWSGGSDRTELPVKAAVHLTTDRGDVTRAPGRAE